MVSPPGVGTDGAEPGRRPVHPRARRDAGRPPGPKVQNGPRGGRGARRAGLHVRGARGTALVPGPHRMEPCPQAHGQWEDERREPRCSRTRTGTAWPRRPSQRPSNTRPQGTGRRYVRTGGHASGRTAYGSPGQSRPLRPGSRRRRWRRWDAGPPPRRCVPTWGVHHTRRQPGPPSPWHKFWCATPGAGQVPSTPFRWKAVSKERGRERARVSKNWEATWRSGTA